MPAFLAPVAVESHTKNPWLSGYPGHVFKCSYRVVMDMDLTAAARAYNVYSGTFVKTKIDEFLNVSGSRHCSIEQQCREVALCWRDVPDG